ncbi:MAG: UbiX family flavin prenyltransferase [Candidatus Hodarchaeales archaeon]
MVHKRIVVALTGASGIRYGFEVIKALSESKIETHLIISKWGEYLLEHETNYSFQDLESYAFKIYKSTDMKSPLASSSTIVDGMIIIPATVKTISNIACANAGNLIARAADNVMKMRKQLIIAVRETPLSPACIENLMKLSSYGAIILPLSPGFYHHPKTIQDLYDFITGKVLDCFQIPNEKFTRWKG